MTCVDAAELEAMTRWIRVWNITWTRTGDAIGTVYNAETAADARDQFLDGTFPDGQSRRSLYKRGNIRATAANRPAYLVPVEFGGTREPGVTR